MLLSLSHTRAPEALSPARHPLSLARGQLLEKDSRDVTHHFANQPFRFSLPAKIAHDRREILGLTLVMPVSNDDLGNGHLGATGVE